MCVFSAMYLSSYKTQKRIVYFSEKRRKFACIILLNQTKNEMLNSRIKRLGFDFMNLSDRLT